MHGLTFDAVALIAQVVILAAVGFTLLANAYVINTLGRLNVNVQQAVDAITQQLVKAQREVVSRIADVQAQLDAAGVAEQIDLSSLAAAAQALDDVVPDAASPAPQPEAVEVVEVFEDVDPDTEPAA